MHLPRCLVPPYGDSSPSSLTIVSYRALTGLLGETMNTLQLSDVQLVNLSMLITMRDNIKRDPVSACCTFGLRAEQASVFADLQIDHILAMVANVGHECLFPPRDDLLTLLKLPVPLAGPITSVRPPPKPRSSATPGSGMQRAHAG